MVNQVSSTPPMNDNQTAMQNLKQYGGYIISAIVLALAGYFGWTYYQNHGGRVDKTAVNDFAKIQTTEDTITSLSQKPKLSTDEQKQLTDATAQLQKDIPAFVSAHPNSIYAWQALMLQARQQTDSNDLKGAVTTLQQASQIQLNDAGLEAIATVRYAQALIANGQTDEATTALNKPLPPAFDDAKEELLGDISLAKNDRAGAISHYQKAWAVIEERNKTLSTKQDRAVLRLKMESLGLTPKQPDINGGVVVKPAVDEKIATALATKLTAGQKTEKPADTHTTMNKVATSAPTKNTTSTTSTKVEKTAVEAPLTKKLSDNNTENTDDADKSHNKVSEKNSAEKSAKASKNTKSSATTSSETDTDDDE